jgi:hypothetical protein
MEKHIRAQGLDPADHVMHPVATIGDIEVKSSKHLTQIICHETSGDETLLVSIMRQDGGLQELVDALQSQVIK